MGCRMGMLPGLFVPYKRESENVCVLCVHVCVCVVEKEIERKERETMLITRMYIS